MGINYSIYKNRLIDYLRIKGIECTEGQNARCFIPGHSAITGKDDSNFSCTVNADYTFCHACKQHGDIYDAVQWFEGIEKTRDQYNYLASLFGGKIETSKIEVPKTEKKRKTTELDPLALETVKKYMSGNPKIKEIVKDFFTSREKIKGGSYPKEIVKKLTSQLLYWPGSDIARSTLSLKTLRGAGIPYAPNPATGFCSWGHSGIVIPLATGFKLHYCTGDKCNKFNSRAAKVFPLPVSLDITKPVVLVEGELDAIISQAAGFTNVYSTGSVSGLTAEMIKTHLLQAKEIIFMYDNDDAGKSAMGFTCSTTARGKLATTVPDKLIKNGYTGIIKIALLEEYKDPDECIRMGHPELIQKALDSAQEYKKPTKEEVEKEIEVGNPTITESSVELETLKTVNRGNMTKKELKQLLKQEKFSLAKLDKKDVAPFISACINAVSEYTDEIRHIMQCWGAPVSLLNKPKNTKPSFLVTMAERYGLSYYFVNKIKHAVFTNEELYELRASPDNLLIPINFDTVRHNKDFINYINKNGNKAAANLCAFILSNRLAYSEDADCFYRFNGHVWEREPDPWGVVYNILATILNYFISHNTDREFDPELLYKAVLTVERRSFRNDVVKDLKVLPTIWHKKILFDGVLVKETLTLLDGVVDFSGKKSKKVHYRNSRPEEFRMKMLPYKIDDVRNAEDPKEFFKFMKGNFKNADTLEMFNQFISTIPSRCAKYKFAGILVGKSHTGKTTTLNIIRKVYSYQQGEDDAGEKESMLIPLPADKIMIRGRFGRAANGPDPFIAQLIGAGAAVCDETDKNDKIDSSIFKAYTGGGALTVRDMYKKPVNYEPTAQIIISTNYSPKFDSSDQAVINRMVIVPFSIVHEPDGKNTKSEDYFIEKLTPEFPAIVKYYAEKYIYFKTELNGKIQISKEADRYKGDYVQNQATDLSRFVDTCIEFVKDDEKYVRLKDIYNAYLQFVGAELDNEGKPVGKDVWTQTKFTRYFKGDYNEVIIGQKKYPGHVVPDQIVLNCVLKNIPENTEKEEKPVTSESPEIPFEEESPKEENPFDNEEEIDIY